MAKMNNKIELLSLPRSAGSLDILTLVDNRLSVHGWMFQPGYSFDYIEAYLDGRPVGQVEPAIRPDVVKAYTWLKDARPSGFSLEMPTEGATPTRLDLVGYVDKMPIAWLSCLLPCEADMQLPLPPTHLAQRVSGFHGPAFRAQGLRMFTDLVDQMTRLGIPATRRIMDWGCGCGRVTHYLLTRLTEAKILGCDIDEQAIAWCRKNFGADFIRVETAPPTPFSASDVDVIIACSVLTHLSEAEQDKWLDEMRRILVPGGYFLASTHGQYAFQMAHPEQPSGSPCQLSGITDSQLDSALDGIAPPGYYRAAFQSREHTVKACSKYFEVVDYVERGLCGHQDLIILRHTK